jgi:lipopolysaccharide/colanic/teichoic acid biosynthesis glycosyltransferase
MIAAAIGVKISSPGPVLFKQTRVGAMGKKFKMLKFRSMRLNAESKTAWSTGDDPRKTKFGAFIRKTAIDELPQLFNVLSGNMSLVGPRPEIPVFVNHFKENIPLYMIKHYVKPGMTGLAQIKGFRGDTSIEARIHEDIHYIENWSLGLDLYILLKTPLKAINKNERYVDSPEAVTDAKAAELLAAGEEAEREEARLSSEKPKERRGIFSWFAKKSAKTEEVSDTGIDEATAPPEENVPESEPSALAEDDKPQDKDGETDE